jgi:hypothetical protein
MSEVRMLIREAERDWSGTIHGSSTSEAIAALSADPVTMEELETAVGRFVKRNPERRHFSNLFPGSNAEPYDAGLVVIDLVARLVYIKSTYSSPGPEGTIWHDDAESGKQIALRYHLADDWLFYRAGGDGWEATAKSRRLARAANPDRDVRSVLYGKPLLEFIGRQAFAAFARRDEIAAVVRAERVERARQRLAEQDGIAPDQVDASRLTEEEITPKTWPGQEEYANLFYDTLKDIHAAWLLTPRDDLGGTCPREIAFERQNHVSRDMQDRSEQWSYTYECPPGLAESSQAFRYAPLNTHELVMYYDLVRELLWDCWRELTAGQLSVGRSQLSVEKSSTTDNWQLTTAADFLTTEVPRLERFRDAWLDGPDLEHHGRTPRSIIDHERARLPEGVSGREAMVDPDCPCCQMMADMPGPSFWHLDGSAMDDEFAFDIYHRTREEWDSERREWDERSRRYDAERAERERLGVTDHMPREDGSNAVWSRTFVAADDADVPVGIRVFGIGCRLAELIVGLRGEAASTAATRQEAASSDAQGRIDQLNRDFGNLREVLQSSDLSLTEALLDPVLKRFVETLDTVATARTDLAAQCESLTGTLQKLLDPQPPGEPWEPSDFSDDDVPF